MGIENFLQSLIDNYGRNLSELAVKKGVRAVGKRYVEPKLSRVMIFLFVILIMDLLGTLILCIPKVNIFVISLISFVIYISAFSVFVFFFIKWCISISRFVRSGESTVKLVSSLSLLIKNKSRKKSNLDFSGSKPRPQSAIIEILKILIPAVILFICATAIYFCVMFFVFKNSLELIYEDISAWQLIIFPFYHSYKFLFFMMV